MKSLVLVAGAIAACAALAADPVEVLASNAEKAVAAPAEGWGPNDCIDGRSDREVPEYAPGEAMTFTFGLRGFKGLDAAKCVFDWTRMGDDGKKEGGRAPADRPLVLTTSLDRPGFVRYYVELKGADGKAVQRGKKGGRMENVFFDGGAGVELMKIRQGVPEPEDFDAFWAKSKAELAKVPWKDGVRLVKLDSGRADVEAYTVSIPCAGGMPATGFLYVPTAAKEGKKFPARIGFHGYGASWSVGATRPNAPGRMQSDYLTFGLSAHGFELMREPKYYSDLRKKVSVNKCGYAFDPITNNDPEKAYFRGMTYRLMRALEYLKSRPEWDGKYLLAHGGSMGGLQSIWAAALDHDVTHCRPDIPWCCDIGGETIGRNRGDWYVRWVPGLGYYDPVNMAKRIPATCNFFIPRFGLGDYICPPTGVLAMYNNLKCQKGANAFQNSTHGYVVPRPRQMFSLKGDAVVPFKD